MQPIKIPLLAPIVQSETAGDLLSCVALRWSQQAPSSYLASCGGELPWKPEESRWQLQKQTNELKGHAEVSRRV